MTPDEAMHLFQTELAAHHKRMNEFMRAFLAATPQDAEDASGDAKKLV